MGTVPAQPPKSAREVTSKNRERRAAARADRLEPERDASELSGMGETSSSKDERGSRRQREEAQAAAPTQSAEVAHSGSAAQEV
jgi:hypothetical protein